VKVLTLDKARIAELEKALRWFAERYANGIPADIQRVIDSLRVKNEQ
jgi:hypothetical protein